VCSTLIARVDTAAYTEASSALDLGIQRGIVDDTLGEVGAYALQDQPLQVHRRFDGLFVYSYELASHQGGG
jgi:hypothetical protein